MPKQRKPVDEYLKLQGRFNHLKPEHIEKIQNFVDQKVKAIEIEIAALS